jgi:pyruvate kinase
MGAELRRAKILSTVGPASSDPDTLRALVEAGSDAIRINFAHASHKQATAIIAQLRDLAREIGRAIAVLCDLQGPRVRVGALSSPIRVSKGERYRFVPEGTAQDGESARAERAIPMTFAGLASSLAKGNRILLDDGRIAFEVASVQGSELEVVALTDGDVKTHKGMNLPGVVLDAEFLTEKDRRDLEFARSKHVDYVGLSFVQRARDIEEAREEVGGEALIIAKIEKDQALKELDEIIRLSDGVMVARGDLGVELPFEEVPMVQKQVIGLGQELARPVITATQMLESMTQQPRPTRAEVSDVANALLDGTDAVMLSAETAVGKYPVESVRAMARIVRRIESQTTPRSRSRRVETERSHVQQTSSAAISAAAVEAVERLDASCIVTLTRSGFTARVIASQRPPVPILAVTDQWRTYNQLSLVWGVHPIMHRGEVSYDHMRDAARDEMRRLELAGTRDRFVVTAGVPFHVPGTTNMMRIEHL